MNLQVPVSSVDSLPLPLLASLMESVSSFNFGLSFCRRAEAVLLRRGYKQVPHKDLLHACNRHHERNDQGDKAHIFIYLYIFHDNEYIISMRLWFTRPCSRISPTTSTTTRRRRSFCPNRCWLFWSSTITTSLPTGLWCHYCYFRYDILLLLLLLCFCVLRGNCWIIQIKSLYTHILRIVVIMIALYTNGW